VKQNGGAAGIDGMEIVAFRDFLAEYWDTILGKLREGSYCPSPVRRVEIPKPDGTKRPLGIPTVLDRVIQQAMAILCRSPRAAQRVMGSVARYIEQRLKLVVNPTKSKVCEIKDAAFLGFTLVKNQIKWSEK